MSERSCYGRGLTALRTREGVAFTGWRAFEVRNVDEDSAYDELSPRFRRCR